MDLSKSEKEMLIEYLNAIINLFRRHPLLVGFLLEKQIELKREIMDGEEFK